MRTVGTNIPRALANPSGVHGVLRHIPGVSPLASHGEALCASPRIFVFQIKMRSIPPQSYLRDFKVDILLSSPDE